MLLKSMKPLKPFLRWAIAARRVLLEALEMSARRFSDEGADGAEGMLFERRRRN